MHDACYEIGWWIESTDEEIYGPVSRVTLQRFLQEGVISKNTLVRHCTEQASQTVAEQPEILAGAAAENYSLTGDRVQEVWPRSNRDRAALATAELGCARHNRPAELVCLRCHAPYCGKCRSKPFGRQFYFCRPCMHSHVNRRILAYFADSIIFSLGYIFALIFLGSTGNAGSKPDDGAGILLLLLSWGGLILLVFRDALFRGDGPGKYIFGLRTLKAENGEPVGYGQALVRYLPLLLPFLPVIEAIVLGRDPLLRRYGDRWAKTRVVDSPAKLAKVRGKTAARMQRKGQDPVLNADVTPEEFAKFS